MAGNILALPLTRNIDWEGFVCGDASGYVIHLAELNDSEAHLFSGAFVIDGYVYMAAPGVINGEGYATRMKLLESQLELHGGIEYERLGFS